MVRWLDECVNGGRVNGWIDGWLSRWTF